jgi:hypothetical protein
MQLPQSLRAPHFHDCVLDNLNLGLAVIHIADLGRISAKGEQDGFRVFKMLGPFARDVRDQDVSNVSPGVVVSVHGGIPNVDTRLADCLHELGVCL